MAWIPEELKKIDERAKANEKPTATVRELLRWFDAYRRSWRNVAAINAALTELRLETRPSFEAVYIDATVNFHTLNTDATAANEEVPPAIGSGDISLPPLTMGATGTCLPPPVSQLPAPPISNKRLEPAHQISRLKSANTRPVWVDPNATVKEAISIMLHEDFSQLPVLSGIRDARGIFSWRSYASNLAIGKQCIHVRECMEPHKELAAWASLYDAIPLIVQHDCVLIRALDRTFCGIITQADLTAHFQDFAEPFFLLHAIENHLRTWISTRFQKTELQDAKDPADSGRQIEDASDLTFGEYVRLLENPDNWTKLKTNFDKSHFTAALKNIRDIRNDVMHFDPDPMAPSDLAALRQFSNLLAKLEKLGEW